MVRVPPFGRAPRGRDRRDDNICIIFNARTSGLRGGRQPPHPAVSFLVVLAVVIVSFASSLPLFWSPSAASHSLHLSLSLSVCVYVCVALTLFPSRARDRAPPPTTSNATSPLPLPPPSLPPSLRPRTRPFATPSNIPLKSIPPHCLLYLPGLIIRTQIYCVSLAARNTFHPL